jgi:predicted nucleotidyltransferase
VLAAAERFGATNVRVFGSVARGDATPNSDIDLLVDFDVSSGLLPLISLAAALEEILGFTVDITPTTLLKDDVARTALIDAVVL